MMKHNHYRLVFLCIFLLATTLSKSQFFDSLEAKVGLEARFSSKDYQPLWLVANRYGTVADRSNDLNSYIRVTNRNVIGYKEYMDDQGFYGYHTINLSYGASLYNNNHFHSVVLEEAFAKVEYKNWSFRAGRFEETSDDIDPRLSSGSLGVSANALPIPKVGIAVTEYTNVPFTNGWLQFRGTFAHGWLGSNRYIKNTYYHEKTFFLRAGRGSLKFYGGLQHFAEWGGNRGDQQLDKSFSGFVNVLFAKGTGNTNSGTIADAHAGDQRGVLEGGIYWENDMVALHGYLQKPFEGINDISVRNKNMLAGFVLTIKDESIALEKILFEVISTKGINSHIPASQRESYYNNSVYKTGWEYENNIIGTPLFINRQRANKYFPEIQPFDWNSPDLDIPGNANIVNNRVFGVHTGALYSFSNSLHGRTLLTYTKNYGSLVESDPFAPGKNQFYGLQELSYEIADKNLTITAGIGFDSGQLSKTSMVGALLGIEWNITGNKNASNFY